MDDLEGLLSQLVVLLIASAIGGTIAWRLLPISFDHIFQVDTADWGASGELFHLIPVVALIAIIARMVAGALDVSR